MLARELQSGLPGFAVAASAQPSASERIRALFAGTPLRIDALDDAPGAAWAATLKNVYVPLVGAADGLALGDNMRGFLIAEALRELAAIIRCMGGNADTAYSLAGLGDLVTSATGASSHHRRIGAELAVGHGPQLAATGVNIRTEGVHTLNMVRRHRPFDWEGFALFSLMCRFLDEPTQLRRQLLEYLDRRFGDARGSLIAQ
jgi:glycerol-3-phosphate dehydrogenase (NAD(P)+)